MPQLPKILLLGDSIRMSYQPHVKAMLAGRAEVVGPADNCRFALYTVHRVYDWIAELGMPDIVHWNNGLWDCSYFPNRGPHQFSVDDYVVNIKNVLSILRGELIRQVKWAARTESVNNSKLEARVIRHVSFATSTPIDMVKRPFDISQTAWREGDVSRYNSAAVAALVPLGVPVNDLYSVMLPNLSAWTQADGVHLTDAGQQAIARAVVSHLEPVISRMASEEKS